MISKSISFVVPFLNGATWLRQFIEHYQTFLRMNENNLLVFVEGITSFHSSSEYKNYSSVDGSVEIINEFKDLQIKFMRQGKVYHISELINAGIRVSELQDYFWPLGVHEFISFEMFEQLNYVVNEQDAIIFKKVSLCKDLSNRNGNVNVGTMLFKNIEGLEFKKGQTIPVFKDTPDIFITQRNDFDIEQSLLELISVKEVETQKQFIRRIIRKFLYDKWFHNNIQELPNFRSISQSDYVAEKLDQTMKTRKLVPFKGQLPNALQSHPWTKMTQDEIWNYQIVFPNFGKIVIEKKEDIAVQKKGRIPKAFGRRKILEIGCATGHVLKHLQDEGWDTFGIDPSLWSTGYAKYILELNTEQNMIENVKFEQFANEFDVILLWDSFEHIRNPISTLEKIVHWLKLNAFVMIYTPNFEKFSSDKRHWLWSPQQHYFLYTPSTLRMLLEKFSLYVVYEDNEIDENGFFMIAQKLK